ncbi:beta-lactamase family protein [Mycobacterium manitobense]|uniref:Beta-lactamase family protein n=1 Tax=[Mycobacterium] manitobense TaxID=190147 RepID=A0A9X3BW64_9MYCO|nr:serine hydrolase domain-containing protein [[Mycobacterium] manitobense]MCV7170087.1 beta-lactamase family protein [[Mycobacterium] manitobense]
MTRLCCLAGAVVLLAAGCTSSADGPTTPTPPTTATTGVASTALKTVDAQSLRAVVEAAAKELEVPGALVLLQTPQGRFVAPFGTTEIGAMTPPTPETHFRIASNTKTMTAALIVLLAQDGKLAFDDPVSRFVSDVPNGDNITVAQLMKMRTGLYGYTGDPELSAMMDADLGRAWTPGEVLAIAFRHPPNFAPDAEYEYSNTNYALLGLVAEKAGGRPLAQQLQERLFAPAGMAQTSLPAADDTAIPAPFSHGYMYGGSFYALGDDPYPPDMQAAARDGSLKPVDYTHQNSSYATAAGGAISTADDLATWMRALVSGRIFDADHHRRWQDALEAEDPDAPEGQKYGFGISYQRFGPQAAMFYHGGELPGFNSFMGFDAENDVTLVIWTNLTLSPDGRTTAQAMLPILLDEIYAGLSLTSPPPTTTR